MQFTGMSIWLFTSLAVITAGVLAVLQYLLIRPRQVRVITTLFWQQALDQARARTLFERFRHIRTYLLLLSSALLVLLALAKPVFNSNRQPYRVIVLEAGLSMTADDGRFDEALKLVRFQAASLNEDRVAVIAADPYGRLIKHFDESLVSLENRLKVLEPTDIPVIQKDVLQTAKSLLDGRDNSEVVMVCAQPVESDDPGVRVLPAGEIYENAFVLSASFVPDTGDLTGGAFSLRVGYTGEQGGKMTVKAVNSNTTIMEQSVELKPGDIKDFNIPGIAADGSVLTAMVSGEDAVAGDNVIDFRLPDRRRIVVVPVSGSEIPVGLAKIIDSLEEVIIETDEGSNLPVVQVGGPGSGANILVQPADESGKLMAVQSSGHWLVDGLVFEDALCRVPGEGVNVGVDNQALLTVNGTAIASLNGETGKLTVSENIFDEESSLFRRTGYMVFWSNMLHYLAGWTDEPMALSPVQAERSADALSTDLVMKADMSNFDLVKNSKTAADITGGGSKLPVWQILLLAAFAFMIFEAVLNIRGRIS